MSERDDRAAAIRARWAKATPGPWVVQRNGLRQSCGVSAADGAPLHTRRGGPWGEEGVTDPDDAAIAHAPEDIAWLLAEVERMRDPHIETLIAQRDAARAEVERLAAALAASETLVEHRLRVERDAAIRERDKARAERDAERRHAEFAEANVETWMDRHDAVINVLAKMPNGVPLLSPAEEIALAESVVRERDEARAEVERLRAVEAAAQALLAVADGPFERDITEDDIAAFREALRGEAP